MRIAVLNPPISLIFPRSWPVLLLGTALLVGSTLRLAGLFDRLPPTHREAELVILAYTRGSDPPAVLQTYGPGGHSAGPAVLWRRLWGIGPGAIERGRLASAVAGIATIAACWWLGCRLSDGRAGAVAAAAYAIAPLAVLTDRLALPASTAALGVTVGAALALMAYERRSWPAAAVAAGVLLASAALHGAVAAGLLITLPAAALYRIIPAYVRRSRAAAVAVVTGAVLLLILLGPEPRRWLAALTVGRHLAWSLVFDLPVGGWVAVALGALWAIRRGRPPLRLCVAAAGLLTVTAAVVGLPGGRGSAPAILPALPLWLVAAASTAPQLAQSWHKARADRRDTDLALAAMLLGVGLVAAPSLLLSTRWAFDPANAEVAPNEQWEYLAGPDSGVGCAEVLAALRAAAPQSRRMTVAGQGSRHSCLRMRLALDPDLPVDWQDTSASGGHREVRLPLPPDSALFLARVEYLVGRDGPPESSEAPAGWHRLVSVTRPQGVHAYTLYRAQ